MIVSVIIPNYNHAKYLPLRIESVLNQTEKDFELLILDDCSPDNSREIIERYAAQDARIRMVYNTQNSGSTFKQWNKGIALAEGKYIWIAESDDYAEPTLLEKLVSRLEANPQAGLAYCHSWDVDEHNVIINPDSPNRFYDELDPTLWTREFTLNGRALLRKYMSYRNIIPNASAVVLRRQVLEQVGPADETYRLNGDWLFWAKILAETEVIFIPELLNYFRKHTNNVRSATVVNGTGLLELTRVVEVMRQYGEPDPYFLDKMRGTLIRMWLHAMVWYQIPLDRHRQIRRNLARLDPTFYRRFYREFNQLMLPNKMSGLRQLLGDGLLYRLIKKRR